MPLGGRVLPAGGRVLSGRPVSCMWRAMHVLARAPRGCLLPLRLLPARVCTLSSSQGELDLPRGSIPRGGPQLSLPAPTERHAVLLQDRKHPQASEACCDSW